MTDPAAERTENWLVVFGCLRCAERGVTPPRMVRLTRRTSANWDVEVRVPRIGLPRPGNTHDALSYARRFFERHPEGKQGASKTVAEEAARTMRLLSLPNAENLHLDRGQFAPAPKRGRVTVECGRGHRIQATAASLIRLANAAIEHGSVETQGCGLLSVQVAPLRPWKPLRPTADALAFT